MKKSDFNAALRKYVSENLSPKDKEKQLVAEVYESIQQLLGQSNCLQIGSYPRYTAITPMHDLDVLYVFGKAGFNSPSASETLRDLHKRFQSDYKNPTDYRVETSLQTHSVTIAFLLGKEEVLSVDVVPALIAGRNEFGDDTYLVPELLPLSHAKRKALYAERAAHPREMGWIKSDPRGYIKVAQLTNEINSDFRKSVKFLKAWRTACKGLDDRFPLKSFHIEQVVTRYFQANPALEIFDAIFNFFHELPSLIEKSQVPDRADSMKNIDEYVDSLSAVEKRMVLQARDFFMKKLEDFSKESDVADLLAPGFHRRTDPVEAYLFDQGIPVLTDDGVTVRMTAKTLPRKGGFREAFLDRAGLIEVDRKIEFRATCSDPFVKFKWKVKNDDASPEPRGEITDNRTKNDPENSKFRGRHFVECYAIKSDVCIARTKQPVVLNAESFVQPALADS